MTRTPLTDEDLFSALDAERHFSTIVEASASLGMSPQTYRYRLNVAKNKLQGYEPHYGEPVQGFSTPCSPTDKMPTDELIEHMTSRYNKRRDAKDARQPIPVRMSDDEPVGLMFFGDPHLDSPQCDWPELRRCVAICESTEGMRGVSLGDHTDNWIGRLQREFAASEASAAQGWQLADWFIKSIDPLLIIRGNHDAWSGHGDPLEYIRGVGNLYEKWKALVELRWPNGRTTILDISHDHVGTSQFHPLHGQVRQARFNRSGINADLYIAGHRHTWGLMTTEMQGRVVWMCRARGFKDHGEYETVKGFEIQKLGHTITAVFDPNAYTETGFISCFAEPEEAAEFLTYKRGR